MHQISTYAMPSADPAGTPFASISALPSTDPALLPTDALLAPLAVVERVRYHERDKYILRWLKDRVIKHEG